MAREGEGMRTYSDCPLRGIGFPIDSKPSIQPNHIDGPLLVFRDGQLHWLTLWERLQFAFGLTDAEKIERARRPNLLNALAVQMDMRRRKTEGNDGAHPKDLDELAESLERLEIRGSHAIEAILRRGFKIVKSSPCVFEARGMDGGMPTNGTGRIWCQTHGSDCPQLRAIEPTNLKSDAALRAETELRARSFSKTWPSADMQPPTQTEEHVSVNRDECAQQSLCP